MFSKRNQLDVKKSTSKIQDPKKDLTTRIKHLKIVLDNVDISEAKGFFEANFSHVYNILYDSFIQAEYNLRQREISFHLVHKAHKEELECALWILEQVLCLLPELIHKRWQMHSLGRLLSKLLHPGNSFRLRRQGIRYFLMWYQALNENAPDYVDGMYASLVPGFISPSAVTVQSNGSSIFHDTNAHQPVLPSELLPILPPSTSEKTTDFPSKLFLEALLEHMVQSVVKLEWLDKAAHYHRCFNFLLEKFKIFYLPKICPNFRADTSLYRPTRDLPTLRKAEAETEFVYCRVALIMWLTSYIHQSKKLDGGISTTGAHLNEKELEEEGQHESAHPSLDSNLYIQNNRTSSEEDLAARIVREVLYSSRDNVNFLHELLRHAFLLNFNHIIAIRKTIQMYRDLIQSNVPEIPLYMLELPDDISHCEEFGLEGFNRPSRLRNDSYLGAIHEENLLVRAGLQNVLQLFMTHAANVFLLDVNQHIPKMLEEQTDACKRVLNIYRYMVMNTRMDNSTWEQLLLVLLQITSLVLVETPPKKKIQTLGGKLAPAIFQTLIVTWIKANLNVMISQELWDRFLHVLVSLTKWEDLIKEWAKTMDTLTRVLARHVYELDLTDLPLDRLAEQKSKRIGRRPASRPESCATGQSFEMNYSSSGRQDSSITEGTSGISRKRFTLSRSSSESDFYEKKKHIYKPRSSTYSKHRRSLSLDSFMPRDVDSMDRSRSPSPAPSSVVECNSIKDSPLQLDMMTEHHHLSESPLFGEHRGVVCGGSVRGWLPDVAVILWRRMLGSLGDVNDIIEPKLHHQVFSYLVKLTDTLIKIKTNQGISSDNLSTPQPPDLIPPLTLIIPWCFGALMLPDAYDAGKLDALRLLCTISLNCDSKYRTHLSQFYYFLHLALTKSYKSYLDTSLRYLGPRFLSLQLPGSSVLLLDLINACNSILNSSEALETSPRSEAVSIVANLLSQPNDFRSLSVLQPDPDMHFIMCPDIKEHVVSILLRAGRREAKGKARCIALSALGMYVYREMSNKTFHSNVTDAIEVILQSLKFNNKVIAQLASNILFSLCDHAILLWNQYPKQGSSIISTLCSAISAHAPLGATAGENDKALETALLKCLGEWCMTLGPKKLLEYDEKKQTTLLQQVFMVLSELVIERTSKEHHGGLSQPSMIDGFDPNIVSDDLNKNISVSSPSKHLDCQKAITLCAKTILAHLITHLGHFPMAIGAARLSSLVVEQDDVPNLCTDELSTNIFSASNIQIFMLNPDIISSFIELPTLESPGGGVTAGLLTSDSQVRVLLRDLSGKACWDASILYKKPDTTPGNTNRNPVTYSTHRGESMQLESLLIENVQQSSLPQRAMRNRSPSILPEVFNSAPDLDQLDDLLQYLGHTSSECLENPHKKLNEPAESPVSQDIEQEAIASVISQRLAEIDEYRISQNSDATVGHPIVRPDASNSNLNSVDRASLKQTSMGLVEQKAFQQCRLLFSQLGMTAWDKRQDLHLLNKTERLLRELRNLDSQCCRETHKVAVIYVGPGQEDKNSILSNQGGSVLYEEFLASLAWEIELESHTGFLGGLQRGGSTGLSAPYYATSFLEVIFHVATRMPGDTPEAVLNKTRHLGNDEVHIVWSDHNRDYRRDIIPTEFCDILITIYPLGGNLHRVTVNCKPDVPYFGVLFDEVIVETNILAGLVRATAICASRSKRTTLTHYQQYYEERARSLNTVVTDHKDSTIFEEFISRVYSPSSSSFTFSGNSSMRSATGDSICSTNSGTLAAALLDSHGLLHRSSHKTDSKIKSTEAAKGVWFNSSDLSQVESTSISPRPLKKITTSFKNVPKKVYKQESIETPPESPQQMTRKK